MKKVLILSALFFALIAYNTNAQGCMHGHNHSGHSGHSSHENHEANNQQIDSTLIRTGIINVAKLDLNKDEFVFQCEMHANVIGDYKYKCPLCDMRLKEVSISEATLNLKKNEFEVDVSN